MGFNFGAFAGAAAKTGVDTYERLGDEERKQQAAQFQKEQQEAWRKEQAGNEALRTAASEVPTSDTVTAPNFGAGTGGIDTDAPMVTRKITPEEKMATFRQRALALGADPMKVQQYEASGLQMDAARQGLKKGGIELGRLEAEDKFHSWMQDSVKQIQEDPVGWVRAHMGEYNKPKAGTHLDDKLTGDVVAGADGRTFSFVQKDSKGKVVSATPITAETAMQGLQQIAFSRYTALPGKFKEATELGQKDRQLANEESRTGIMQGELDAKKPLYAAQANAANAHAGALRASATATKSANLREFTDAKGNSVLVDITALPRGKDGEIAIPSGLRPKTARPEISTSDLNNFLRDQAGVVVSTNKDGGKPVTLSQLPMSEQIRIARNALGAGDVQLGGFPDVDPTKMVKPGAPAAAKTAVPAASTSDSPAAPRAALVLPGQSGPAQGGIDRYAPVQEAYDAWQNAKGPWYLPTPMANENIIKGFEREYLKALQQYQAGQ